MYPIMSTGNTVIQAVKVLKEHGVKEDCIILSNLFCTPVAVQSIIESYPKVIYPMMYLSWHIQIFLILKGIWIDVLIPYVVISQNL